MSGNGHAFRNYEKETSMKKRILFAAVILALLAVSPVFSKGVKDKRAAGTEAAKTPVPVKGTIRLSTTTSTQDSGLLDNLLPLFTAETGWNVDVISVGTGAALKMGEDGEADVLLVHARAQEEKFVDAGHGLKRFDVMYNDFIVVGPNAPIAHNDNVNQTFKTIAAQNLPFVSRGDKSGTHTMELNLWKEAGVDPAKLSKYTSAGQGMGATLQMADELKAYTLADRATWLKQKGSSLVIVCEKGTELLNFYGVIAVNPEKNSKINAQGAQDFINWMLSDRGQKLISEYGVAEFGGPLFTPNAQANK
jgi:tungstate transport system substrate-binding protein